MARIFHVSLGSNLGDRGKHLSGAACRLEKAGVRIVRASSVYETEPVDFSDQPWFLNQVLEVETDLAPQELLELAKAIEREMKRAPSVPKGPRTIDIDILLAGDMIVDTADLTVPHPAMARRNFVLAALDEIAPDLVHPVLHETIHELARRSGDRARVVRCDRAPLGTRAHPSKRR